MWNRAACLRRWVGLMLAALVVGGCAAKQDPFGQQVSRINDISIQGEQWFSQGDLKRASRDFSRALTMSRSVDYPQGEAQQLNNLGAVALEDGDVKQARDFFTQAYKLNWSGSSGLQPASTRPTWPPLPKGREAGEAAQHLQAAQDAAWQAHAPQALARVYLQWASFYLDQNDLATAEDFLNRAQPLATTPELKGTLAHHWGRLALARGDTGLALERFAQALTIDRTILDRPAMAGDLFSWGRRIKPGGTCARPGITMSGPSTSLPVWGESPRSRCFKRLQEVNHRVSWAIPWNASKSSPNPSPS